MASTSSSTCRMNSLRSVCVCVHMFCVYECVHACVWIQEVLIEDQRMYLLDVPS